MIAIFYALLVALFLLPLSAAQADEATVGLFSPQGMVKGVRQVTARFSEPMVPFGDPRVADPFDISCPEKGKGRWADNKNWVYDFDRDLPAGVKCTFSARPNLKALSGNRAAAQIFSFSTGGPAVIESNPHEGNEHIDEEQIFILTLDAQVSEESVIANAFFSAAGIGERIGVKVVGGEERKRLLSVAYRKDDPKIIILQGRQRFPVLSEVRLVWGKGIMSLSGVATERDQTLVFKSREPFAAKFSCERESKDANCIPMLPMRILFNASVPWETARNIRMKGPGGRIYKAAPDAGRYMDEEEGGENGENEAAEPDKKEPPQFVSSISFKGPFPETSAFVIELPKDFRDDAGRTLSNSDKYPLKVRTGAYPPLAKFSSRFGIIELKGDAALPVTLRNLEPEVPTRMIKVDDRKKDAAGKAKEGILNGAVKLGEALSSVLPDSIKQRPDGMVEGLKGRLRRLQMTKEERVIEWLRMVAGAGRQRSVLKGADDVREFGVPKPGGGKAFEVVGIPLKEPGFYVVEMESRILGSALLGESADSHGALQKRPVYIPTAALVTNLGVHFKQGRESSIVWVTTLDKAAPVRDASVTIRDCAGKQIWSGKTDAQGIARISKSLPDRSHLASCPYTADNDNYYDSPQLRGLEGIRGGMFVFAKKDGDMSFVHSSWNEGIETWRYGLPAGSYNGPVIAHTIFDRTLLRAGETVHMKHIIRRHTMAGFGPLPSQDLPGMLVIEHTGSDKKYTLPLKWRASGIAESEWKIPEDANLGQYEVTLESHPARHIRKRFAGPYDSANRWQSGSFRVEEFRVPLMKGIIQPPKEPAVNALALDVDIMVSYLSGGGAGNADIKLRSVVQPKYVRFDNYEDFVLANGAVKEGLERYSGSRYGDEEVAGPKKPKVLTSTARLDPSGALRTKIGPLPKADSPQEVAAELEFRDPNGEFQTVSSRIPLWNSRVLAGIRPDSWAASKESFKFQLLALDLAGRPLAGIPVRADLFQRKNYSHRKRLIGGFYAYEHIIETKRIGTFCEGTTDSKGLVICEVKSPVSGNVIVQATAKDAEGNVSTANRDVWVYGKGEWWFDISDNDRIDLLPEKKRYEPGEKAKFQVRMPFRKATVLVTVEREGVIEAFTKRLSGRNPVIELPVKGNYAPNVFVSALCVRGRVEGVKPTALIDLGKPAFKLGISEIKVGWKAHELKVEVSSQKDVYKIREKARMKIKVRTADGASPPKGSEVTVAAVDEGLLELMPNNSWKLLEAMMTQRGYEVETSTAQMQVVGKRHYGLKALPHGGGGGRQTTRELFDTLLLWKGTVKLNDSGEASVDIPLNDSLTSFRIVAVATGTRGKSGGLFGTGQTSIRTTQDLMLISGLPPLAREGDSFSAGFTVRNASSRLMDIAVSAASAALKPLEPLELKLQPGEAREISWQISVPHGLDSLSWEISAREKNGDAEDRLRATQKIIPAVRVSTYQGTISQLKEPLTMDVEKPADAVSGRGGIRVSLSPKLAEGISGITEYMKWYPYACLEQKTSIAVALRDRTLWDKVVRALPSYMDQEGLLKYFPAMPQGSDALTAYVLSISSEAGFPLPENLKEKMIEGLTGFVNGKVIRYSSLQTADISIRKMAALEALSRPAGIRPDLLGSISVEPNLWPTSAVLDWMNVLQRSKAVPDRITRMKEAEQILRSRLNFQGTTMGFSTEQSDYLWWLMISADVNAVRSVLTLLDLDNWNEDMPRVVRGAVGRQHKGRWGTTVANAWGVLALEKFSRKFESVPVTGKTIAALPGHEKALDWNGSPKGGSMTFKWPRGRDSLTVSHQGSGRPWATIQSLAAIPLKESLSSGFKIKKTLTPVVRREKSGWSRGDVVRVRLELESQSDMTWVVVNDPVPAGSSILGTGLGRDSEILTRDEKQTGWVWPAFEERSFEAYRAYYEYVPKGRWTVEYTVRLNNDGDFVLPETRVEALYAPEMFGMIPNRKMEIAK